MLGIKAQTPPRLVSPAPMQKDLLPLLHVLYTIYINVKSRNCRTRITFLALSSAQILQIIIIPCMHACMQVLGKSCYYQYK